MAWDTGMLAANSASTTTALFAYDEVYSINYFGANLSPYWRQLYAAAANPALALIADVMNRQSALLKV
jgi:hypothetical protein